jgi:hypothetical protein
MSDRHLSYIVRVQEGCINLYDKYKSFKTLAKGIEYGIEVSESSSAKEWQLTIKTICTNSVTQVLLQIWIPTKWRLWSCQ